MEDNKIAGLDLPLEYLDLPDDEQPLAQEEHVEAIAAVQDLDLRDGYAPLESVSEPSPSPSSVSTAFAEDGIPVYGINLNRADEGLAPAQRLSPALVMGIVAAAFVLVCGLIFVPAIMAAREPEPELHRREPIQVEEAPAPEPGLTTTDIIGLIASLAYKKTDVSIAADQLGVALRDGHVVVTQTLDADTELDARDLVVTTGRRSTALAAQLTDASVTAKEGDGGVPFARLTWIVRDANGDAYLAISELPGELRGGKFAAFMTGADGCVLSQSLFDALGGADSDIAQENGNAPVDLEGAAVVATAELPQPEPEPEPEPEESYEEYEEYEEYDEAWYDEYEDEWYYEYEYDDTSYEEDTTTEVEAPAQPAEPEPQAFVVPDDEELPADEGSTEATQEEDGNGVDEGA